jgi:predicted type IV restriction endonuclease
MAAESIGSNENNVKYKFIIPFLEAFGYERDLDFEHAAQGNRLDIFIRASSNHCIVVEAKSYGRNLDEYVAQLKRYCDEKRPIIAIISNGEDIRFYSPFWRKSNFADTLIYSIARRQLSERVIIDRIEAVLGKQFLDNGSIETNIDQRETEIEEVKRQVRVVEQDFDRKTEELKAGIVTMEEQINALQLQIAAQGNRIENLRNERDERVGALEIEHLVRLTQEPNAVAAIPSPVSSIGSRRSRGRKGYEQLSDYVLPVIRLMVTGVRHSEAFRRVAEKLDVEYSTAAAQCTTRLKLSTEKFVELVDTKKIKDYLKEQFPARASEIVAGL